MSTTLTARPVSSVDINTRVEAVDWATASTHLDSYGWAMLKTLLTADECESIAGLYEDDRRFRSHVVMARHGFGRGEYKYFAYPLPDIVAELRTALYPRLAPIANHWNESMSIDVRFPDGLAEFIGRCHKAGQTRPTPLLLQYAAGDFNALHQDLYGEHVFPLQMTILLSEPEKDFDRRRVRVDRATAPDAIAGRGGAAPSGRRRGLRGARSSGARDAWHLSRQNEARGEPAALRPSPHRGRDLSRREMIRDLFEEDARDVRLAPGAMLLGGFAQPFEAPCVTALRRIVEVAPFRHMVTPGGHRMSVAMTNCGTAGWVTDRTGYRYDSHDPQTGRPWPAMPGVFADLAAQAAARAGFDGFAPDACLINRYEPGARLSLHQDKDERDFSAPIVSVSLGLPAVFLLGGLRRARPAAAASRCLMATWSSGAVPPAFAITASCRSGRDTTP